MFMRSEEDILNSGFHIISAFIPIRTQADPWQPGGSLSHDVADFLQWGALVGFDDHFVMDMADDVVGVESLHGFCEDVPADCLDDVFDKLGAVAFDAAPFFVGVCAEVCHGFTAVLVFANLGFGVGEAAAGGKIDEKYFAFVWLPAFLRL